MRIGNVLHINKIKMYLWYIIVSIVTFFFALPFLFLLSTAFKTAEQASAFPPQWIPNPFTFRSFFEGFMAFDFFQQISNSLIVTSLTVLGVLLSSPLVAFGFTCFQVRYRNIFFMLMLSTMMIPGCVTLIPAYILYSKLGLTNTFVPLVLPAFLGLYAIYVFLIRQFFLTLPKDLNDAARIDGCSWFQIYLNIYIPNSKVVLFVVAIFTFVGSWNDFFYPLIFLFDPSKYTIAIGLATMKNQLSTVMDLGPIMAMSLVALLPVLILFLLAQKYFVQGIATTGLKG